MSACHIPENVTYTHGIRRHHRIVAANDPEAYYSLPIRSRIRLPVFPCQAEASEAVAGQIAACPGVK